MLVLTRSSSLLVRGLVPLTACAIVSCKGAVDDPIDTTGFSATACPAGATSPFDGLTSTPPFDYLELRQTDESTAGVLGTPCATATQPAACMQSLASATTTDTWDARPAGGAPPPGSFLVMTRGDVVEAIGASTVAAFLSPVDSAPNAAFLAQIATEGTVDCSSPDARQVAGGWEIITTTVQTCGGGQSQSLVLVTAQGAVSISRSVQTAVGSGGECP